MDWPKLIRKPDGNRVMVIAPHMDDEILGCGGVLIKHADAGDKTAVVYITDGSKGKPNRPPSRELSELRKKEAAESNKLLGVNQEFFLDMEDGNTGVYHPFTKRMKEIINEIQPDLVYLPYSYDRHPDHRNANFLFRSALSENINAVVCAYEVWTPLEPNILVNITKQISLKLKAIMLHKSQLEILPYHRMTRSLNAFRAAFIPLPGLRYAEAFYCGSLFDYINKIDAMMI